MPKRNDFFRYMRFFMMFVGIWRLSFPNFLVHRNMYVAYSAIYQMTCVSSGLLMALKVPLLFETNVPAAIDTTARTMVVVITTVKLAMCQSRDVLGLISQALEEDYRISIQEDPSVRRIYRWHSTYCNNLVKLLVGSFILLAFFTVGTVDANILASLASGRQLNYTTEKLIAVHFWYPYDESRHYAMAILEQHVRTILSCLTIGTVTAFINFMIVALMLRLKLLQYYFKEFQAYSPDGFVASARVGIDVGLKLVCQKHQELIKSFENFNRHMKHIILLEYTLTSVMFAGQLVQLVAGERIMFNSAFIALTISQLMIFAWNSNEIVVQSAALATALLESSWYEQPLEIQKEISFMVMRCQKPLRLTIGAFGTMDIGAAISRMKLGYSYTSVMSGGD
ncbi:odorant receptor 49b-like isoform X2 [Cylas formicarius]|uniref:odorant receptor 49b-like isoform X2 n=1 Tax=Cylas formicarius TaxID=197179 RepID=UPI002958AA0D|nr:odorant receptor 49b-like isoform X2 [Cylas formicarius]